MTYEQAHDIPVGELVDLVTIYQVQNGRAKLRHSEDDEDIIPNVR